MWKHLSRANCLPFALISFQLRRLEMVAHHYCRSPFTVHDLSPTVSRRRLFICSFCLADKCCTQILQTFLLKSIPINPIFFPEKKKTKQKNNNKHKLLLWCVFVFWRLFLELFRYLHYVCVFILICLVLQVDLGWLTMR